MFLPNADSFVLIRGAITLPRFTVFSPPHQNFWCGGLPNTYSFLLPNTCSFLIRKPIIEPGFTPLERSRLLSTVSSQITPQSAVREAPVLTGFTPETEKVVAAIPQSTDAEQPKVTDQGKRNFLKVAGVAGAGIAASLLLPKKADALIMGSSPTTGVVGVKNAANTRINPATEETVSTLLKPSDLTFDTGSLQVKVTSLPTGSSSFSDSGNVAKSGLVDADRHVQVDVLSSALPATASTETTLQTISFGGFKYTLRLATVGDIDYVGEAAIGTTTSTASWRIKRVDSATGIIIQWAGTGVFDQIWDNRASLSYS